MTHGIPCNAYSFVRKGKIRIDKRKLKKFKIKEGRHLSNLKEGKNIIYNGKRYLAKNLAYHENEKKISIVLDTSLNNKIAPLVKNSDVFICESSFHSELGKKAKEYQHLTAEQTADIAKKAKVKRLILTHISQRYNKNQEKILREAKKIFRNVYLAKDLDVIEV